MPFFEVWIKQWNDFVLLFIAFKEAFGRCEGRGKIVIVRDKNRLEVT